MKPHTPDVSFILPTYNEKGNIVALCQAITAAMGQTPHELIVVDDDSPDGTSAAVSDAINTGRLPYVRLITRKTERGLTRSIQEGIDQAKGAVIGWMDCDFSHPPEIVPALSELVLSGKTDVAVASRFVPGGKQKEKSPIDSAVAVGLSTFLNRILALIAGFPFTDFTSGFIALRRDAIRATRLSGDYGEYFVDLIVRLHHKGFRIREIPYVCAPRRSGETKTAPDLPTLMRHGILYLRQIFLIVKYRIGGANP